MLQPERENNSGQLTIMQETGNQFELEQKPFDIDAIKGQFVRDLISVAPDLDSNNIAERYTASLFNRLVLEGANSEEALITKGEQLFYHVGREVFGPLAVHFVHHVLDHNPEGKIVFLARDASPLYYVARTLVETDTKRYAVDHANLTHETFHRKFWGVEDEQVEKEEILTVEDERVKQLLRQMGFGNGDPVTIVDIGAWGSMADHLRQEMPHLDFNLYFLYTHLPNNIYGHLNQHAQGQPGEEPISDDLLETIADTWEAFPRFQKRQTMLEWQEDGSVKANGDIVNSPYLYAWSRAAIIGLQSAAEDFVRNGGEGFDLHAEIQRLGGLAERAKEGEFTGILPGHTETWSEGESWKANWRWGKIPPLV